MTAAVIGAGHAGLAASHFLTAQSVDHVVLERGEVANSWRRERWDSLRLLTPNWQSRLPGLRYEGPEPDGYMTAGEVTEFIERFAKVSDAPVRTGVNVTSLRQADGGYHLATSQGDLHARTVVIASGACNQPSVPALSSAAPASVEQVTPFSYCDPAQFPDGGVLVVGASATGVQLAAELQRSGRPVTVSVGEHVRLPRTYRGRDVLWWMDASGVWDQRYDEVEDLARARRLPSPQLAGTAERTTLDLRALASMGVGLVGRWAAVREGRALFSGGLRNVCSLADLKMERLLDTFDEWSHAPGMTPRPAHPSASRQLACLSRPGCSLTCEAAKSARSCGRRVSGLTTGGLTCLWSTRRASCGTRGAWSIAPGCTRWDCPCCDGANPRSSAASRTTLVR
jgi:putative flavoprotein involved in K+ transport